MEKSLKQILTVKENGESVQYYIRDLNTWENEMKRKEAALKSEAKQELPPVRSKLCREKSSKNKKHKKKQSSNTNYETFDPNKPYEQMDLSEVGPLSLTLNGQQSEVIKQMQLKENANYEKERGNKYVKVERWDDAIACYTRAIQLVKDDAIYYANRGLCYLKKESLHQAEADCTEALRLDPTYVKALQRRATAREKLGSLRAASNDLTEVLKLEPQNVAAKKQLDSIKQRMGTKGRKAKSSPTTPQQPSTIGNVSTAKSVVSSQPSLVSTKPKVPQEPSQSNILGVPTASQIQIDVVPTPIRTVQTNGDIANWKDGVGENILVIKPVKKPPHLRSKRALKSIPIKEIPLGSTTPRPDEPTKRVFIEEVTDYQAQGDTNINENDNKMVVDENIEENKQDFEKRTQSNIISESVQEKIPETQSNTQEQRQTNSGIENGADLKNDFEKIVRNVKNVVNIKRDMVPPTNSVQFMSEWRNLKGDDGARSDYLSLLEPNRIPKVFANALESDVLSEIIHVLHNNKEKFDLHITAYLKGLAQVRRLSTLVMFLSAADKELIKKLLIHCKTTENCSDNDIDELTMKYEL